MCLAECVLMAVQPPGLTQRPLNFTPCPTALSKPKACSVSYGVQHSRMLLLRFGSGRQPATDRLQQIGGVDRLGNVV
jgi:hypothetical protein